MRKIIAISFLFVFTVLQYGKIASWIYCELRVKMASPKATHCDCEKIVTKEKDKQLPLPPLHSHSLKDKLNEFFTTINTEITIPIVINTSCFLLRTNDLQKGFLTSSYHPPALVC